MTLALLWKPHEWTAADPLQTAAPDAMQLGLMCVWAAAVIELGLGDSRWAVEGGVGGR